jgi:hypothetical protein
LIFFKVSIAIVIIGLFGDFLFCLLNFWRNVLVSFIKCDLHSTTFDLDLTTFEECDVVDVQKHVCPNEDLFFFVISICL